MKKKQKTVLILSNAANLARFELRGVIAKGVLDHVELTFSLESP